ncbi:hypothetical protein ebA769 [Aromatoleum aromaticum EbN1]|uniref:Uncharacterized protein n=1 Tax=Aromatoleum aromaticum (strain DSM 19018 / LMG 30748 / EbN1) TaxID=76114 RepID=Q5P842_AROAE|nr:hypothetical protein ebA769 [Aromatoleum aromaticum EbN1]
MKQPSWRLAVSLGKSPWWAQGTLASFDESVAIVALKGGRCKVASSVFGPCPNWSPSCRNAICLECRPRRKGPSSTR